MLYLEFTSSHGRQCTLGSATVTVLLQYRIRYRCCKCTSIHADKCCGFYSLEPGQRLLQREIIATTGSLSFSCT